MTTTWFAGNFCPRGAKCSEGKDALTPSNGPKIRTMDFETAPDEVYTATVQQFTDDISFFKAGTERDEWAKCEGQLLSIPEHSALFSLLGTHYGGDGHTTFGLPDLKGEKDTAEVHYYIFITENFGNGFVGP